MALISELLNSPHLLQGVLVASVLLLVSTFYKDLSHGLPYRNIPIVGRSRWEVSNSKAKARFMSSARQMIMQGFDQVRSLRRTGFALELTDGLGTHDFPGHVYA